MGIINDFMTECMCFSDQHDVYGEMIDEIKSAIDALMNEQTNDLLLDGSMNKKKIVEKFGVYDKRGIYNACVRVEGERRILRGRSEALVINGERVYLWMKDDNTYELPGGSWDKNESHEDAAYRETKEEARFIVKDLFHIGNYLRMVDTPHKWVKENIPKKDWWYGYYTEVYIGTYDKPYTGYIAKEDQDEIVKKGEFYEIKKIYHKLKPIHQQAIDWYFRNK